jgi:hypothetical protein
MSTRPKGLTLDRPIRGSRAHRIITYLRSVGEPVDLPTIKADCRVSNANVKHAVDRWGDFVERVDRGVYAAVEGWETAEPEPEPRPAPIFELVQETIEEEPAQETIVEKPARGVVWCSEDRPSKGSASERIIQYLHRAGEPVALEQIKLDLGVSGQSVSNAARHWTSYLHRTGLGLYAAVTEHLIPASVVIGMAAVERRIYSLPGMDDFVVRVHVLRMMDEGVDYSPDEELGPILSISAALRLALRLGATDAHRSIYELTGGE